MYMHKSITEIKDGCGVLDVYLCYR